jgi:hypothetical protein
MLIAAEALPLSLICDLEEMAMLKLNLQGFKKHDLSYSPIRNSQFPEAEILALLESHFRARVILN